MTWNEIKVGERYTLGWAYESRAPEGTAAVEVVERTQTMRQGLGDKKPKSDRTVKVRVWRPEEGLKYRSEGPIRSVGGAEDRNHGTEGEQLLQEGAQGRDQGRPPRGQEGRPGGPLMGDPERMAREEGAAARVLGNPRTSNPYREAQYESDFYVGLWSAWECGWVQGRRFVEERCAAREQLENVRTIMRAEARR